MYRPEDFLREYLDWHGPEGTLANGYGLLTEIARLYRETRNKIGQILTRLGYRDSAGRPTRKALNNGFVAPRGDPKFTWAWHIEKACAILDDAGLTRR